MDGTEGSMFDLYIQVKVLQQNKPLLMTWWNSEKLRVECCLVCCPCQGYNLQKKAVNEKDDNAKEEQRWIQNMRVAMSNAEMCSLCKEGGISSTVFKRSDLGNNIDEYTQTSTLGLDACSFCGSSNGSIGQRGARGPPLSVDANLLSVFVPSAEHSTLLSNRRRSSRLAVRNSRVSNNEGVRVDEKHKSQVETCKYVSVETQTEALERDSNEMFNSHLERNRSSHQSQKVLSERDAIMDDNNDDDDMDVDYDDDHGYTEDSDDDGDRLEDQVNESSRHCRNSDTLTISQTTLTEQNGHLDNEASMFMGINVVTNPQAVTDQQILTIPQAVTNPQALTSPQTVTDQQILTYPQAVTNPQAVTDQQILTNPQAVTNLQALTNQAVANLNEIIDDGLNLTNFKLQFLNSLGMEDHSYSRALFIKTNEPDPKPKKEPKYNKNSVYRLLKEKRAGVDINELLKPKRQKIVVKRKKNTKNFDGSITIKEAELEAALKKKSKKERKKESKKRGKKRKNAEPDVKMTRSRRKIKPNKLKPQPPYQPYRPPVSDKPVVVRGVKDLVEFKKMVEEGKINIDKDTDAGKESSDKSENGKTLDKNVKIGRRKDPSGNNEQNVTKGPVESNELEGNREETFRKETELSVEHIPSRGPDQSSVSEQDSGPDQSSSFTNQNNMKQKETDQNKRLTRHTNTGRNTRSELNGVVEKGAEKVHDPDNQSTNGSDSNKGFSTGNGLCINENPEVDKEQTDIRNLDSGGNAENVDTTKESNEDGANKSDNDVENLMLTSGVSRNILKDLFPEI